MGVNVEAVPDRRTSQAPYRFVVYLLRRAANLPLEEVAASAGVSPPRVSQIQRRIEDAGGLGRAVPWAGKLARKYKVKRRSPEPGKLGSRSAPRWSAMVAISRSNWPRWQYRETYSGKS